MEILLIVAGVIAIVFGFGLENPIFREKFVNPEAVKRWQLEEARIKQLKMELVQAKDEVAQLLVELERTSEKVVNDLAETIVDIRGELRQQTQVLPQLKSPEIVYIPTPVAPTQASVTVDNQFQAGKEVGSPGKGKKPAKVSKSKLTEEINVVQGSEGSKRTRIYQLADQGLSIDEIAQRAKIGKGEVQLMLGLRGRGE